MSDAPFVQAPLRVGREWSIRPASLVLAVLAVAPLLTYVLARATPRLLLQANPGLGFVSELEQPLTVDALPGVLALALVLAWWGLAYRTRALAIWEPVPVLVGCVLALVRLGNVWCVGLLLVLPLAQQIGRLRLPRAGWLLAGGVLMAANLVLGVLGRPPTVPDAAAQTIAQLAPSGAQVFAYQPWAASLQKDLGSGDTVVDASALETWQQSDVDGYQHVSLGGLGWEDTLAQQNVSFLVLNPNSTQSWLIRQLPQSTHWQVVLDSPACLVAEITPA